MAKSLNKVMLIGNLGKDPELRYTTSGVAVATFTLATNESWKDQDGNLQEKTEWHNIVAWKKLAEICGEWLKKGKKVYIEGRIQTRSYEDKNTGTKRYFTEIVADNMLMLDGKGSAQQADTTSSSSASTLDSPLPPVEKEEDLPF
ncbi:MAG: single-stranded DNA-binding protein [Ignavibacteriae bacterium]|nr:single-stranded DNA-binding protein [Ignavibacteriota bacterium]